MQDKSHELKRFLTAQESTYQTALSELKSGQKVNHWMWFIFPQYHGLGFSPTTELYAIKSIDEANAYLDHPVLGRRYRECCDVLITIENKSANAIMGNPDDLKLRSSLTLFNAIRPDDSLYQRLLDKYYSGKIDLFTLDLLPAP